MVTYPYYWCARHSGKPVPARPRSILPTPALHKHGRPQGDRDQTLSVAQLAIEHASTYVRINPLYGSQLGAPVEDRKVLHYGASSGGFAVPKVNRELPSGVPACSGRRIVKP